MTEDCIFCKIVAGEADAKVVQVWSNAIAIVPLKPITIGHLLFIPFRHLRDFTTSPIVTGQLVARAADYAKRVGGQYNLIASAGTAASQTIFHLHVHLVPRHEGDGLVLPWTEADR